MRVQIVAEDSQILVCYKPAGLAVQSGKTGVADAESELLNYQSRCVEQGRRRQPPYLGVIHRLDQPVSGLLVFAKTREAAAQLSRQVSGQGMNKYYYAWAYDAQKLCQPDCDTETELTDYLLRDGRSNTSRIVAAGVKDAKKAQLYYSCIRREEEAVLLRIRIMTGRHHQIRVQMAHAGLPLLADAKYGSEDSRRFSVDKGLKNIMLCAYHLEFTHPVTGLKAVYETGEFPMSLNNGNATQRRN